MKQYNIFCFIVLSIRWKSDTEKFVTFQDVNGIKSIIQVIYYTQISSYSGVKSQSEKSLFGCLFC